MALKAELTHRELAEHVAMLTAANNVDRRRQRAQSRNHALVSGCPTAGWAVCTRLRRSRPRSWRDRDPERAGADGIGLPGVFVAMPIGVTVSLPS
jgi:hypothetical protein